MACHATASTLKFACYRTQFAGSFGKAIVHQELTWNMMMVLRMPQSGLGASPPKPMVLDVWTLNHSACRKLVTPGRQYSGCSQYRNPNAKYCTHHFPIRQYSGCSQCRAPHAKYCKHSQADAVRLRSGCSGQRDPAIQGLRCQ